MELRHIRAFCVVAQEMQVTKAAKRLGIAQPALTQQIRSLERALGQQLVRPKGRGIELTAAGAFFHREAETLLQQLHDVRLKVNEIGRGERGVLRIGITEGASYNPTLASVLSTYTKQWPDVQLSFTQRQSPELAADLRNDRIDAAFVCPLPSPDGLALTPLYAEEMLLASPFQGFLAQQKTVSARDLQDVPLFLISHGYTEHSLENSLKAACEEQGFSPRIVQTVPEFMLALNLVAAGLGCTFVPPYMQNVHLERIAYRRMRPACQITMETVLALRSGDETATTANLCAVAVAKFAKARSAAEWQSDRSL